MPDIENLNERVDQIFKELNEIRLGDKRPKDNPTRKEINGSVLELRCVSDSNDYSLFSDCDEVINFRSKPYRGRLRDQHLKVRYLAAFLNLGYVSNNELWSLHERTDERGLIELPNYLVVNRVVHKLNRVVEKYLILKNRWRGEGGYYVGDLEEHRQEDIIEYKDKTSERKYRLNTTTGMVWMPDQREDRKNGNLILFNANYPFRILELLVKRGGSAHIDQIKKGVYDEEPTRLNIRVQIDRLNIWLGGQKWKYVIGPQVHGNDSTYRLLFEPVPKNN